MKYELNEELHHLLSKRQSIPKGPSPMKFIHRWQTAGTMLFLFLRPGFPKITLMLPSSLRDTQYVNLTASMTVVVVVLYTLSIMI